MNILLRFARSSSVVGLVVAGLFVSTASAQTATVPGTYPTIQSALSAGNTVIHVGAGTFAENLYIFNNATIIGAGAGATIIDGSGNGSVISIYGSNATTVTISGVTVQNGAASLGGGLSVYGATLNLSASTVTNNTGYFHGGGLRNDQGIVNIDRCTISNNTMPFNDGAGIRNFGRMTITNSTIANNTTAGGFGGGIAHSGLLTMVNCTVSGNSGGYGGGIGSDGAVELSFCTFVGNASTALPGGGVLNFANSTVIKHSIFADSPIGGNYSFPSGGVTATGANFSTDGALPGFTVVTSAQLALGALAYNGGPTATHALLPGSVALDAAADGTAADGLAVSEDQRGTTRPQGAAADAGAFELTVVLTPTQQVAALTAAVNAIGGLTGNDAAGLLSKLDSATSSLAKGNKKAANGQIGAFINQVNALKNSRRLTAVQAQSLTAAANATLAAIGG